MTSVFGFAILVIAGAATILAAVRWIAWRLDQSTRGEREFRFRHDSFLDDLPPHEDDDHA